MKDAELAFVPFDPADIDGYPGLEKLMTRKSLIAYDEDENPVVSPNVELSILTWTFEEYNEEYNRTNLCSVVLIMVVWADGNRALLVHDDCDAEEKWNYSGRQYPDTLLTSGNLFILPTKDRRTSVLRVSQVLTLYTPVPGEPDPEPDPTTEDMAGEINV